MINELHQLARALNDAGIQPQSWHKDYKPIPKNAPCICITCSHGQVVDLSFVTEEQGKILRKYGSNQGTYPCMNLAPLYRLNEEAVKVLNKIEKHPESLDEVKLAQIKSWCQADNSNWRGKFLNKYRHSLQKIPAELSDKRLQYPPLEILLDETKAYGNNLEMLHKQLEEIAFGLLRRKEQVSLALYILFYCGKAEKSQEYGSISVAFDSTKLIQMGVRALSKRFVSELNQRLLQADFSSEDQNKAMDRDAFGISFQPVEEPLPSVKLAGGFDATLRTMYEKQYCQTRYGKIGNASYPLSDNKQKELAAALDWLSCEEHKNMTWVKIGKQEILFAYPYERPERSISFTRFFKPPKTLGANEKTFEEQAKRFIEELHEGKDPEKDSVANRIQLFILRKLDKARTKVVYTRQTDACEIERCSEEWTLGCAENLPEFPFGKPVTPFPLDTADILNRFWKQNGELISDKFRPIAQYHGMKLLLEPNIPVDSDLRRLCSQAITIGGFLGNLSVRKEYRHGKWEEVKGISSMTLPMWKMSMRY